MICIEISKNGEKQRTVGAADADYIRLNSVCFPHRGYANLQVFVEQESIYAFMRRTPHYGINIEPGDEISFRLVDEEGPDPVEGSPALGARHLQGDRHELLCSLCGKSSRKAKKMVGTAVGFICAGCIGVAWETVQDAVVPGTEGDGETQ